MKQIDVEQSRLHTTVSMELIQLHLRKKIADITDLIAKEIDDTDEMATGKKKSTFSSGLTRVDTASLPRQELIALIESLTEQMRAGSL
jgi:excinuclease ABC subunit B